MRRQSLGSTGVSLASEVGWKPALPGDRVGKMHRASCFSHFKSRLFNLRDALCENRAGSLKVWREMGTIKDRGCSPDLVRAHAHNGMLFAPLLWWEGGPMPRKAIKIPDHIEYLSVLD